MKDLTLNTRVFAFIAQHEENDNHIKNTINELINNYNIKDEIFIFSPNILVFNDIQANNCCINVIQIPFGCDNNSKMKNFVIDYFKEAGFNGFAHILEDNVIFFKDPSKYLTTIEKTMSFLDYDIHFSTVTDPCNYIFSKFNPRITLDIDNQTLLDLGLTSAISFTSHSNAAYIIYNFNAFVNTEIPKFNESFSVAMYMIIEFLARRKAQKRKDQLYYMNQYLNIKEEIGVFGTLNNKQPQYSQQIMQEEDAIFKSLNVNYAPDNSVDVILDTLYAKILEKTTLNR